MAQLTAISLNQQQVSHDLEAFHALLSRSEQPSLDERRDILPFFKQHPHLCAAMGIYASQYIDESNISMACDFDIFGDHVADLVVGDLSENAYTFIEFENAAENSVFKKTPKLTPEWSTRFEHGFSQLVDWILWLENNKGNAAFRRRFNAPSIRYNVLLVIGRDRDLSSYGLRERLEWRTEQVVIASKKFNCITFDKLYYDLSKRYRIPR